MSTPLFFGPTKLRMVPERLMTKAREEHHQNRLLIAIHTFELLNFPVRVRSIESLGIGMHRGGVRLICQ